LEYIISQHHAKSDVIVHILRELTNIRTFNKPIRGVLEVVHNWGDSQRSNVAEHMNYHLEKEPIQQQKMKEQSKVLIITV